MYPRLSVNKSIEIRDQISAAMSSGVSIVDILKMDFKNLVSQVEEGDSTLETKIEHLYLVADSIKNNFIDNDLVAKRKAGAVKEATTKGEYFEELMSEQLHRALENLDTRALHDPGFWRFHALFPYRWYLLEREPEMQARDFGGLEGSKPYWLLIRTFIIGRKSRRVGASDEYLNSRAYREARRRLKLSDGMWIDFYHSQIVRKRWHDCVEVSNVFTETCTSSPEALDEDLKEKRFSNALAKNLRRLSPNILFASLPTDQLRSLMDKEKNKTLGL